jgi:cytochrome c oxidase subunit 4
MGSRKTYILVWAALLLLTASTLGLSYVRLGAWNVAVALAIASVKASLVGLWFMHLRKESPLVWAFALVPLLVLALIILGTFSDTLFRK